MGNPGRAKAGEGIPGHLLVLAAAVLWGTTGTAQAFAPTDADPLSVGAARIGFGGFAILAFAVLKGDLRSFEGWPLGATATAALAVAVYQPLFFAGVSLTGVAVGTVAALGSAPVWAGLAGFLLGGEKPTTRWCLATTLAVAGCALLFGGDSISVDPLGVVLCLGSGAGYVVFASVAKGLLQSKPPAAVMGVIFSLGAVALSPALLFSSPSWIADPRGVLVAVELGLFATAIAYLLFAGGLSKVSVATAATLSLAEPLTAGTLGVALLGERLTPAAVAGVGLLLSGLILTSTGGKKAPSSTAGR